ncbi:MAG: SOS response-associated peptidase [Pseudomonadota bacterium]
MCGRYSLTTPVEALRTLFRFEGPGPNLPPRWNIAPTQSAPVVAAADGGRALRAMRWGLVPAWAKDASIGARMINARAETVADKPAFRAAFKARRCLVPADGFYEWQTVGAPKTKQPGLFRLQDEGPFAFAGLWERWRGGPEPLETFAILTTAANQIMASFHDRMPIVLAPADHAAWLDPGFDARPLLKAPPSSWFSATRVSTFVNNVRNDDARCFAPAAPEAGAPEPPAKRRDGGQASLF